MLASIDETGEHKTAYEYVDGTNVVRAQKLPNGSKFAYGYGVDDTITSITQSTQEGEENSTNTLYTCGEVTELTSGHNLVQYKYDFKRRLTSVYLNGTQDYETYSYTEGESSDTVTMTNAKKEVFTTVSDKQGNVLNTKYGNSVQIESTYTANGDASTVSDKITNSTTTYSYNDKYKVQSIAVSAGTNVAAITENYSYTAFGEVLSKVITGAVAQTYTYHYKNNAAHSVDYMELPGGLKYYPQKDVNDRETGKEITDAAGNRKVGEYITYRKVGDHATKTPATIFFGDIKNSKYVIQDNLKYTYDASGNISEVRENGNLVARYAYDTLNRLSREDNKKFGKTWLYNYDNCGNILSRRETGFTLKERVEENEFITYEYGYDGDKLMRYGWTDGNGRHEELFGYDVIGNPTVYRNKTAGWQKGRELNYLNGNSYTYDGQGKRITRNGTVFTYDGEGNLVRQSDGLEFIYDNTGVIGVKHQSGNSTKEYIYRKDVQGNIIALLDNEYKVVVKYTYDAWGNCLVQDANGVKITDPEHIGRKNPFRYRGYYYDDVTGLYYLQTRYYDPQIGRFMTIDDLSYLAPDTINGLNLYAYCGNNPVMRVDPNGTKWWHWLAGALAVIGVALVVGAITVLTAGVGTTVLAGTLAGAVIHGAAVGALIGAGVGIVAGGIIGGAVSGWTTEGILTGMGIGLGAGAIIGAVIGGVAGGIRFNSIAKVDIRKFSKYALDPKNSKGKHVVFEKLGFKKSDARLLKKIYKSQGRNQFLKGTYTLGKLDSYGQRITVLIDLNGTKIKTGWMIIKSGIKLVTPFAGFA